MSRRASRTFVLALLAGAGLLAFHSAEEAVSSAHDSAEEPVSSAHDSAEEPASTVDGSHWPQFRGPGGLGISAETGLPTTWSESENIAWKTRIEGRGHSSPVVWGDRIFLTTAIEGEVIPGAQAPVHYIGPNVFKHPQSVGSDRRHTLKALAIDKNSGEIVWSQTLYDGRVYDDRHQMGSYASATAVTDGELVYFYFGSQGLYALDFDGQTVWSVDPGDIATVGVGLGTSPVLFGDTVIVLADEDQGENSFIAGYDKRTGAETWKASRPVQASWATPLLIEDAPGGALLLTVGVEFLIAYDPASGAELWRLEGLRNNAVHTPVWDGDHVFVSSGYPRSVIQAIRLTENADGRGAEVDWEYRKGAAYVSSNVAFGGLLYVTNDKGIITCLNAATGEVVYEGGRIPVPSSMLLASLLGVDGNIMLSTPEGDTFLIKAGRRFEVIAGNSIDEPISATPAIADGNIFVRGHQHLYAIGAPGGAP